MEPFLCSFYNEQTVTPLTQSIKALAAQYNIPIVGVTETIQPSDVAFQVWMNAELLSIQNALNSKALGSYTMGEQYGDNIMA